MSNGQIQDPGDWAPGAEGGFFVVMDASGKPLALHTFKSRRAPDSSDRWTATEVRELRGVDPLSSMPSGSIENDGGFDFGMSVDGASKAALAAFIEAEDPRLHFEEIDFDDLTVWKFE